MEKRDIISSLFFLALGSFFVFGSFMHSIWGRYGPGPGFFPLLFGLLLGLLSLLLLMGGIRRLRSGKERNRSTTAIQGFANVPTIAIYLGCCVGVYLVLEPLGYLITMFLFLTVALPLAGQRSPGSVIIVAAVTSVSIFVLFLKLNVRLPFGPLQTLAAFWGN